LVGRVACLPWDFLLVGVDQITYLLGVLLSTTWLLGAYLLGPHLLKTSVRREAFP